MLKPKDTINRFGERAQTAIPDNATLAAHPGHKLRTSNAIVDRQRLEDDSSKISSVQEVRFGDDTGFIRLSDKEEQPVPNRFTGPSFRNKKERYRFDGHKTLFHLDRVQAWKEGKKFAPVHIDMGLTKFCNTACLYCYAVVQNMTRGTMIDREPLLRFIEDCGRLEVRSIGFIGDGEPTLNPALYEAVTLAKKVGVDTGMATNGLLLDMSHAQNLLRDMTYIRFNLSAGTPEGFQRVHQSAGKNFIELIEKIRALVKVKKEHNLPCTIGLQMVLIPECFDQVIATAKLGAELGVDYFVVKQCADSEYKEIGINYDDYLNIGETLRMAEAYSNPDYTVSVKWDKIDAASETSLYKYGIRKYDVCYGTPFLSQVSGNGKVYPCGPYFNKERFLMGDIQKESYYDMVMSERYWAVHKDISDSVDVHKDCSIGCRHDYVNKFLWDLKNPPEHINFI